MIRPFYRINLLLLLFFLFSCSGKKSDVPVLPSENEVVKMYPGAFGEPTALQVPDKWENLATRYRPLNEAQLTVMPFDSTVPQKFKAPPLQIPLQFSDFTARPFRYDSLPSRSFTWNWEKIHPTSQPATLVARPGRKWPIYSFSEVIADVACNFVFEDSKQLIWLGTSTGLYRWDGTVLQLWVDVAN